VSIAAIVPADGVGPAAILRTLRNGSVADEITQMRHDGHVVVVEP
jgi:hypothetical protein